MASMMSNAAMATASAAAQANMVAPFTGLKSTSAFPVSRKNNVDITKLASNGGKVNCMQGSSVHATINSKLVDTFLPDLIEGDVYIINKFGILPNKERYRVVSESKIMLTFLYQTYIKNMKDADSLIPRHKFDFVPFDMLEQRRLKPTVLSDVYGILTSETVYGDSTEIVLRDKSENLITVKLWGKFGTAYMNQRKETEHQFKLFTIIVTSLIVKGNTSASLRLDTSSSSKIYINLDYPEIHELTNLISERNEDVMVARVATQNNEVSLTDILTINNHCKKPYEKNLICLCLAEVKEVMSDLPWSNPSCPECNRKPKKTSNGYYCGTCNKVVESPSFVYRLELLVEDKTGTLILTMFNDEARKIVGQEASTLFETQPRLDNSEYDRVPSMLRNSFEGKSFLFKIKIDSFNHKVRDKQTFGVMKVLDRNSIKVPTDGEALSDKRQTDRVTNGEPTSDTRQIEHVSSDDESTNTSTDKTIKRKQVVVSDDEESSKSTTATALKKRHV